MFSKTNGTAIDPRRERTRTSAWRLSMRSTVVFAVGSAIVFWAMYALVANSVHQRSDAWLMGENETLKQVAETTTRDSLYNRVVEEVAESASQEVAYDAHGQHTTENTVFFAERDPAGAFPLWVGPRDNTPFLNSLRALSARPNSPVSVYVAGWHAPFRVVVSSMPGGDLIFLGLLDESAATLLERMSLSFFLGWVCMVGFGFLITLAGLQRTLKRVDAITSAAAGIGANLAGGDLDGRVSVTNDNDEISRLARTFNAMLDRVSASVGQLRTLAESVAHDLKSPITFVRGNLETALSTSDREAADEYVARAIENLDHLSEVINTTLDVAEAEGGALRLRSENADIGHLVGQVAALYAPAFAEHNQTLETRLRPGLRANVDVKLFVRMLSNLMENELAHARTASHITLSLVSRDRMAVIEVEDDGPGFSAEVMQRIFQRFAKGQGSLGHGLGLAFVQAVASAHGGQAAAENKANGGALLRVAIPVIETPAPGTKTDPENLVSEVVRPK